MSLFVQDVFASAREAGLLQEGFVGTYADVKEALAAAVAGDECPAAFGPCDRSPEGTCYSCGSNYRRSFANGGSLNAFADYEADGEAEFMRRYPGVL